MDLAKAVMQWAIGGQPNAPQQPPAPAISDPSAFLQQYAGNVPGSATAPPLPPNVAPPSPEPASDQPAPEASQAPRNLDPTPAAAPSQPEAPAKLLPVTIDGQKVDPNNKDAMNQAVFAAMSHASAIREQAAKLSPAAIKAMTPLEAGLSILASAFDPTHVAGQKFVDAYNEAQQAGLPGAQAKIESQRAALNARAEGIEQQANLANQRFGGLSDAEMAKREAETREHGADKAAQAKESATATTQKGLNSRAGLRANTQILLEKAKEMAMAPTRAAQTKWLQAEAADKTGTLSARLAQIRSATDVNEVRKMVLGAQGVLAEARTNLLKTQNSWYPKAMQARIDNANSRAATAAANADTAFKRLNFQMARASQPTSNAIFTARQAAMRMRDNAKAASDAALEELSRFTEKMKTYAPGSQDAKDLQKLIDADATNAAYHKNLFDRANNRLQDIDKLLQQHGASDANMHGSDKDRETGIGLYNQFMAQGNSAKAQATADRYEATYGEPLIPEGSADESGNDNSP
jgi:hypothetical protein